MTLSALNHTSNTSNPQIKILEDGLLAIRKKHPAQKPNYVNALKQLKEIDTDYKLKPYIDAMENGTPYTEEDHNLLKSILEQDEYQRSMSGGVSKGLMNILKKLIRKDEDEIENYNTLYAQYQTLLSADPSANAGMAVASAIPTPTIVAQNDLLSVLQQSDLDMLQDLENNIQEKNKILKDAYKKQGVIQGYFEVLEYNYGIAPEHENIFKELKKISGVWMNQVNAAFAASPKKPFTKAMSEGAIKELRTLSGQGHLEPAVLRAFYHTLNSSRYIWETEDVEAFAVHQKDQQANDAVIATLEKELEDMKLDMYRKILAINVKNTSTINTIAPSAQPVNTNDATVLLPLVDLLKKQYNNTHNNAAALLPGLDNLLRNVDALAKQLADIPALPYLLKKESLHNHSMNADDMSLSLNKLSLLCHIDYYISLMKDSDDGMQSPSKFHQYIFDKIDELDGALTTDVYKKLDEHFNQIANGKNQPKLIDELREPVDIVNPHKIYSVPLEDHTQYTSPANFLFNAPNYMQITAELWEQYKLQPRYINFKQEDKKHIDGIIEKIIKSNQIGAEESDDNNDSLHVYSSLQDFKRNVVWSDLTAELWEKYKKQSRYADLEDEDKTLINDRVVSMIDYNEASSPQLMNDDDEVVIEEEENENDDNNNQQSYNYTGFTPIQYSYQEPDSQIKPYVLDEKTRKEHEENLKQQALKIYKDIESFLKDNTALTRDAWNDYARQNRYQSMNADQRKYADQMANIRIALNDIALQSLEDMSKSAAKDKFMLEEQHRIRSQRAQDLYEELKRFHEEIEEDLENARSAMDTGDWAEVWRLANLADEKAKRIKLNKIVNIVNKFRGMLGLDPWNAYKFNNFPEKIYHDLAMQIKDRATEALRNISFKAKQVAIEDTPTVIRERRGNMFVSDDMDYDLQIVQTKVLKKENDAKDIYYIVKQTAPIGAKRSSSLAGGRRGGGSEYYTVVSEDGTPVFDLGFVKTIPQFNYTSKDGKVTGCIVVAGDKRHTITI